MTTVSTLIAEVRTNINEPAGTPEPFFYDSELINYMMRSTNDICIDTDTNYKNLGMAITGSTVGTITGASIGTTTVFTLATHGLSTDDTIYISGMTGTIASSINDNYWMITYLTANTFEVDFDSTGYAYTTGGTTLLMNTQITFASIGGTILDLRFLVYRSIDWAEFLYDELPKTELKTTLTNFNSNTKRYTCMIEQDFIVLSKAPKIGDTIYVAGRWLPTQITTSTDSYPLGYIEEDASVKYTTAMCWYKQNKIEIGDKWMSLYLDRKKDIYDKKKKLVQSNYPWAMSIVKHQDTMLDRNYISNWSITT